MMKAFNIAACAVGGLITTFAAAVFGAGFIGCGDEVVGACINPAVLTHTPGGFAITAALAYGGVALFRRGYRHLSAKP